jgi:AraC-like DNA-binding protein
MHSSEDDRGGQESLDVGTIECSGWSRADNVDLPRAILLLHRSGGRRFRVCARGSVWTFACRAARFDYYAAGHYDAIACGPLAMQAIRIEIPIDLQQSVIDRGRRDVELTPRFQFQDRRLEALVQALHGTGTIKRQPSAAAMLSIALVDRLMELCASTKVSPMSDRFSRTLARLIVDCIDQSLASPVDVETVASLTGLGRTQFSKLFRTSFGMPLHQYVIARKVHIATRRLLEEVLVTDLSQELGFSSHAHFSTVFKSHVGTTPSDYRKRRLSSAEAN